MGVAAGNTTAAAFGGGQSHAPVTGQSSDFYAPGDTRIPKVLGVKKPKKKRIKKYKKSLVKKKLYTGEAVPLFRRTFPGM